MTHKLVATTEANGQAVGHCTCRTWAGYGANLSKLKKMHREHVAEQKRIGN